MEKGSDIEDAQFAYLTHAATSHTGQSLAWYKREEELRRAVADAKRRQEKTFEQYNRNSRSGEREGT